MEGVKRECREEEREDRVGVREERVGREREGGSTDVI